VNGRQTTDDRQRTPSDGKKKGEETKEIMIKKGKNRKTIYKKK